jgi:hypothetical protein
MKNIAKTIAYYTAAMFFGVVAFSGNTFAQGLADAHTNKVTSPMGCGTVTSTGTGNTTQLVVDGFPCAAGGKAGAVNAAEEPFISVKICAPGSTTNCQIIDHVEVDTGSTGLRMAASALSSGLQPGAGLPVVAGGTASTTLTECEIYVDSYVYGPLVSVDVYIAGKKVQNTQMQVFGDSSYKVPKDCSSQGGTATNSVSSFGANGLIGVSFALNDYGVYYNCKNSSTSSCTENKSYTGLPNTVSQFSGDNNGVTITLPALSASGSTSAVVGTLAFGVSTQANNTPPASTLAVANDANLSDANWGTFASAVGGTWFTAYIDSGTDVIYFNDSADSSLVACPTSGNFSGWYCPTTTQNIPFSYANSGSTASKAAITYGVANASKIITNSAVAYNNVAGPDDSSATVDSAIGFGLSTFFGHNMYFLFQGMTAPGTGLGGSGSGNVTGPINGIY